MPVVPISTVVGARSSRWRCEVASYGERATGIEPAFSAWEADVLPLNYARGRGEATRGGLAGIRTREARGGGESKAYGVRNGASGRSDGGDGPANRRVPDRLAAHLRDL